MFAKGVSDAGQARHTPAPVARKMFLMRSLVALALALVVLAPGAAFSQDPQSVLSSAELAERYPSWTELAPGLALRAFKASRPSRAGDQLIVAARIDPEEYELVLAVSAAEDGQRRTAREWADRGGLVATINAGMFASHEPALPVGFTRANGAALNPKLTGDRMALVFGAAKSDTGDAKKSGAKDLGAKETGAVAPRLLDKDCDDFEASLKASANVLQSIRMISCDGRNVWNESPKEWSTAAIATDAEGRILFVHARSPYSVHDFGEMLKTELGVTRAMYLEGGPEATLFVHVGDTVVERVGSYETGFFESDQNNAAWALPNVIGVRARR
jgi:hypothetical protein